MPPHPVTPRSRRWVRSVAIALPLAAASATACSVAERDVSDGDWVGTITTAGNVTTVVNESGPVWGGPATLVGELSIGVETGADEYMFGRVSALALGDDRIYVADEQVPALRVYDQEGRHVQDIGRAGGGPGEYRSPALIAAGADRVFVADGRTGEVEVFDAVSGEGVDTWPLASHRSCVWPIFIGGRDTIWATVQEWIEDDPLRTRRYGVQAVGPNGPTGDILWVPEIEHEETTFTTSSGRPSRTPFSPALGWTPTPDGGLVAGASDRYRYEVHGRDGGTLVVETYWEPVPIPAGQREWEWRREVAFQRESNDPAFTWDGTGMPEHKPAFMGLVPTLSGGIWVIRYGPSVRHEDCAEDPIAAGVRDAFARPCWSDERIADAFGPDGRFLGEVELPGMRTVGPLNLIVDGARVVAVVRGVDGVDRVKRYRLVVPGVDR